LNGATYFDGQTAADRIVTLRLGATGLSISGAEIAEHLWTYDGLSCVERHYTGLPFRMMHDDHPGARLILRDDAMVADILAQAPQLKGGFNFRGKGRVIAWTTGIAASFILVGYLVLQFAPQRLAFYLPESWRERVGGQVELSLTDGATQCKSADGVSAIAAMAARLAEGNPDLPPLAIHIYDIPVMNAFAMPGERIVITAELIRRANRPEQVAGVLAHEVGHVLKRHSEAQLVRTTGLQILLSVMTGGGGDTISAIAGVTAILTYTREAEAEADDVGLALLERSAIDPMGLKEFFDIILAEEGRPSTGTWRKIESALSTHPGTEDRIKKIHPLPDDIVARPVMTETQWRALKKICGS
jgi:beta-barrel assembly-enhancing protease